MVDYIAFKTGYTSRLLVSPDREIVETLHKDGKNVFKCPLPLQDDDYDENEASYQSLSEEYREWGRTVDFDTFTTPGNDIHDFLQMNHAESPYEIVLISDKYWGEGTYVFAKDAECLVEKFHDGQGVVVFRRKDQKPMNIAEYIPFTFTTFIGYCAAFPGFPSMDSTITPYSIELKALDPKITGKESILVASFDTESG